MSLKYRVLNALFHAGHLLIIGFILIGWAFPAWRLFHLGFILAVYTLWRIAKGCPLTLWHWDLKKAHGQARPKGPYIHFLLEHLTGTKIDAKRLDRRVVRITLCIAALSLTLNLQALF